MCLQISYTLTCEHVKTQTIYCAVAQPALSSKRDHKNHKKDGAHCSSNSSNKHGNHSNHHTHSKKKKASQTSTASSSLSSTSARYSKSSFLSESASGAATPVATSGSAAAVASSVNMANRTTASSTSASLGDFSDHNDSEIGFHMVPCRNLTQQTLPYPTPPSFACDPHTAATSLLAPKCPLPDCPFEVKNRCWNCCWCGKAWNDRGRCSCIMIIEGNQVQCEHICCPECEAADI